MTKAELELQLALANEVNKHTGTSRSLFGIFKDSANALGDVVIHSSTAMGTIAATANSLANAGHIMAQSNERMILISTVGKEEQKLEELAKEFPKLDMKQFK